MWQSLAVGSASWDLDQDRTHNDANEITAITGGSWLTPAHDAAGNMTLAPRPADEADANDGLLLFYDAWNRLVEVHDDNDGDGVADAGELLASYEYDGQRRRIVETIENGENDVVRDSYYNDAWQVVEVREGGDADPLKQFVWDQRYVDSPVVRFRDGNTDGDYADAEDDTLYYTTDANFNVTAVVDDSGNVVERYAYDPYGQVTVLDGDWSADADGVSDVDNRTLYAGYHHDTETGLYHVRHRMYHPRLGAWLQRDPLGYVDGLNLYEYVGSNPVVRQDPMGLWWKKELKREYREIRRDGTCGITKVYYETWGHWYELYIDAWSDGRAKFSEKFTRARDQQDCKRKARGLLKEHNTGVDDFLDAADEIAGADTDCLAKCIEDASKRLMREYAGVGAAEQLTHHLHLGRRVPKTGKLGGRPGTGGRSAKSSALSKMAQNRGMTGSVTRAVVGNPNQARFMASRTGGVFATLIVFGNHLAIEEAKCYAKSRKKCRK